MAEDILKRLRFPNREIDEIVTAVRFHMQFKDAPNMRKATLRRLLLRETFPLELELHRLDCLGCHADLGIYRFREARERGAGQNAGDPTAPADRAGFDRAGLPSPVH